MDRRAEVQGVLRGPLARTLLSSGIHDVVNQFTTLALIILLAEDHRGDLDQERVEFALVPLGEGISKFGVAQPKHTLEDVIAFGDKLHIAVFDAVVNHFYIVTRAARSQIGDTGRAIARRFGGDGCQDVLNELVGFGAAAGHQARPQQGAFFAAADAQPHKQNALFLEFLQTTFAILKEAVATVDNQVTRFQKR